MSHRRDAAWPRWTPGPGAGGSWKHTPEDFVVEEVPLAPPDGEGEHQWLWIEKVGRTTTDVAEALARAAGVAPVDVGFAGLKDREARTVQAFTVRGGAEVVALDGARILARSRTRRRLRVGHLAGNVFRIRVYGGDPGVATERLSRLPVMPNYYGAQRVGGRAPLDGRDLLHGGRPPLDHHARRFALSAWQALLFNRVLTTRGRARLDGDLVEDGGWRPARPDDTAVPTGPMYGPEMPWPTGAARRLEARVLDEERLPPGALERFGKLVRGTRRALWVPVDADLDRERDGFVLRFRLPAGSYATVLLEEVL